MNRFCRLACITILCSAIMAIAQIDPAVLERLSRLHPDAGVLTFPQQREKPIRFVDEMPEE